MPSTAPASLVHATQHKSGGSDPIKLDELSAPTDVTTLNASTASHGLLRKLDNNALHFLDGTHSWSVPTAVLNVARPWEVVVTPVVGDNGVAINTAIDYVFDTYGGGSIILLPQIYTVSTTILRRSNVLIKGAFKASWVFEGAPTKGTVIKWTGASLGTVFKDNPNSPEYRVDGGGISDLTIDGNSFAAYGLEAWNVMSPVYERIHCARIVTSGVAFYWNAHLNGQGVGWESCYHLRINDLSANLSGGATGFWLNGSAASGNNIVFASFRNCHVTFENGTAYRIDYGDDNRFNDCAASKISGGTGYAIWLGAGAYGNGFNGFNSNADIRSISGAMGNYVFNTAVDHAMILTEDVLGSCIVTSYDGVSINSHKSYNNSLEMDTYGWVKRITTTGNMTFNGDNGDFMYYDRTANIWFFYIGNTRAGYIASDGWHNG